MRYRTFKEFWPFYVLQHLRWGNRALHFIGTTLALVAVGHWAWLGWLALFSLVGKIVFVISAPAHIAAALVLGYGFAWMGHFFIERNKPATLEYPFWSLRGDFKMYWLMWRGRMSSEVKNILKNYNSDDSVTHRCRDDCCL